MPNPRVSLVRAGIALCKKENIDFLLAVGGGSVITNEDGGLKKDYCVDELRCIFAVMNPELTYTLSHAWQTACGVTDRAGSVAHNDLTGCGTSGDWATHMLEHEHSGMFDVSHDAGLAAMWGSWERYTMHENIARFALFAVNVMGVEQDFHSQEATAEAGIKAMEEFYHSIGMPTSIHELIGKKISDKDIEKMADKCSNNGTQTIGALKVLNRQDMINIYKMAK